MIRVIFYSVKYGDEIFSKMIKDVFVSPSIGSKVVIDDRPYKVSDIKYYYYSKGYDEIAIYVE